MREPRLSTTSASTTAFGRTFAVTIVALATSFVTLRVQDFIGPRSVVGGLLLSPLLAAACAVAVTWLRDHRLDQIHQRELEVAQRRQHEANLRLIALQAQLEPHFLFNTLASLRALLREDIGQAEALVDALVRHLRSVVPVIRSEVGVATLSEQLAICVSYLDLMSIRLDGRLRYQVDVPESLEDAVVPPLMLLTLVENAIKHGIEPKAGMGRIRLDARTSAQPSGPHLMLSVIDDGVGPSSASQGGLGLGNLREQLALRYGSHGSLSLTAGATGGTVASLLIPHERIQTI